MKKIHFSVLLILILILASCGTVDIASHWRDRNIVIDGKADDWQGQLYTAEKTGLSLGVSNDEKDLYVCLTVSDPRIAPQAFRQGLVVWFDPKGGKDKILGLHYPVGATATRFGGPPGEQTNDEEARRRNVRQEMNEIEILGPGRDERARMPLEEAKGIKVAISRGGGGFVYELEIPFEKTDETPWAVGKPTGEFLGVGFDSTRPDLIIPGRGMGGLPGGFGPGYAGRFPGRGAMIGIGRGRGYGEPIKLWLKVHLASQPDERPGRPTS
jgi:hypothetical protein